MPRMSQVPNWGSWSFNPLVILVLGVAAVLYARAYRRAAGRVGSNSAVGAGHWVPYGAGLLVVAIALMSPLDPIGDSYLLSAHMAQHVLLSDIAPALLVLGLRRPLLPLGLSRGALLKVAPGGRYGRVLARLTSPWVAIPLWATATWVWAIPAVFDFAAEHSAVHAFEHLTLFYTGLALWWLIVDPLPRARLRPGGQRLALLGFSRLASAAVCLPLTWLAKPEYPLYINAPRAFGLSAISDQHLAGAGMCFLEFLVFGIAFAAVFISILSRSDEGSAVAERAAAAGDRLLT
jgi:putative membrane protein